MLMGLDLVSPELSKFKTAYLVLSVAIGIVAVAVYLLGHRYIALALIVLAALVILGGSIIFSHLYRSQKDKDFDR